MHRLARVENRHRSSHGASKLRAKALPLARRRAFLLRSVNSISFWLPMPAGSLLVGEGCLAGDASSFQRFHEVHTFSLSAPLVASFAAMVFAVAGCALMTPEEPS